MHPWSDEERAAWAKIYDGVHITWAEPGAPPIELACRNCGAPGPKQPLLDSHMTVRTQGLLRSFLLDCPACGCAFARDESTMDYETVMAGPVSVAFYVEVGAGLWPIVRCIARVSAPPGARCLEIGCGFGFGIDFAQRERGWPALGIDPSPIAVAARDELGLRIENRYFQMDEAAGTDAGVIIASEVVEHMSDPLAFVLTLKAGLAAGGVLVLTTPDRAALRRTAPLPQIVSVLSVGAHLVLQTAASLRLLLQRAGFAHIEVMAEASQLVAYASEAPLRLEMDDAALRRDYRRYLARRTQGTARRDFVWWGFSARAYQEAVVDHDWAEAGALWADIRAVCLAQFRVDLDALGTLPDTRGLSLWELPEFAPKALPNLLNARLLHRVGGLGEALSAQEALLRAIITAAVDLNGALRADASEDLQTLGVERRARATLAAIAAEAGRTDAIELLAQAAESDPEEAPVHARRCVVGLVNAGRFDLVQALLARWDAGVPALDRMPPGQPLSTLDRDAIFCLGVYALDVAEPFAALRRFARTRDGLGPEAPLWWEALRGECIAGDRLGVHAHADTLLAAAPAEGMPPDLRERRPAG